MAATAPPTTDRFADDPRWQLVSAEPYPLLIGGELRPAADGATFDAISPRDDRAVARVALAGADDVAAAVTAARAAVDSGPWGRSTGRERAKALHAIAARSSRMRTSSPSWRPSTPASPSAASTTRTSASAWTRSTSSPGAHRR